MLSLLIKSHILKITEKHTFKEDGGGKVFRGDLRVGDGYKVGDKKIPPNLPPCTHK